MSQIPKPMTSFFRPKLIACKCRPNNKIYPVFLLIAVSFRRAAKRKLARKSNVYYRKVKRRRLESLDNLTTTMNDNTVWVCDPTTTVNDSTVSVCDLTTTVNDSTGTCDTTRQQRERKSRHHRRSKAIPMEVETIHVPHNPHRRHRSKKSKAIPMEVGPIHVPDTSHTPIYHNISQIRTDGLSPAFSSSSSSSTTVQSSMDWECSSAALNGSSHMNFTTPNLPSNHRYPQYNFNSNNDVPLPMEHARNMSTAYYSFHFNIPMETNQDQIHSNNLCSNPFNSDYDVPEPMEYTINKSTEYYSFRFEIPMEVDRPRVTEQPIRRVHFSL